MWGKTGSKLYGPKTGIDYRDNQLRFSLLCQVAFCFIYFLPMLFYPVLIVRSVGINNLIKCLYAFLY